MADIFLSYSHHDHDRAKEVANQLQQEGWTVFWDPEIPIRRIWVDVVEKELEAARVIIVLWSKESINSNWVKNEALYGLDMDKLFPAFLDKVKIPFGFRLVQTADISDWKPDKSDTVGMQLLISSVRNFIISPNVKSTSDPRITLKRKFLIKFLIITNSFRNYLLLMKNYWKISFSSFLIISLLLYLFIFPLTAINVIKNARINQFEIANEAYLKLQKLPGLRWRGKKAIAGYWERKAIYEGQKENLDLSLLYWIKALSTDESNYRRTQISSIYLPYRDLIQTFRHDTMVLSIDISPDRKRLATGSFDKTARIWDLNNGEMFCPPIHLLNYVFGTTFDKTGRLLLTSSNSHANLFDAYSGTKIGNTMQHNPKVWLTSASFNYAGNTILTSSEDSTARIWETTTGNPLSDPFNHDHPLSSASINTQGDRLLTVSKNRLYLWDPKNPKKYIAKIDFESQIEAAKFNPLGNKVVISRNGGLLSVWNLYGKGSIISTKIDSNWPIMNFRFTQNGKYIIAGALDKTFIYETDSLKLIGQPFQLCHGVPVLDIFSDEQKLISGISSVCIADHCSECYSGLRGWARVWNIKSKKLIGAPFHCNEITSVKTIPNSDTVITGGRDGTVRLWHISQNDSMTKTFVHSYPVISARYNANMGILATMGIEGKFSAWDIKTNKLIIDTIIGQSSQGVFNINELNKSVVIATWNKAVILDLTNGSPKGSNIFHSLGISDLSISQNGKQIVTVSKDGACRLWTDTGNPIGSPILYNREINCVKFSPDGHKIAFGCSGRVERRSPDGSPSLVLAPTATYILDISSGERNSVEILRRLRVKKLAFSQDGRYIVTVENAEYEFSRIRHRLNLWDAQTGKAIDSTSFEYPEVRTIDFSPDGNRIMIATDHWVHLLALSKNKFLPISSRQLRGNWIEAYSFSDPSANKIEIALCLSDEVVGLDTLDFSGDLNKTLIESPDTLLKIWGKKLGLVLNSKGDFVSKW